MSDIDAQEQQHMNVADQGQTKPTDGTDQRSDQEKETDRKLAERLSHIIEDANQKCLPLCNQIRKHIEQMESQKEEDRDENELVKAVKPLLQQAEKILNETNGAIRGADPDNRLSNQAKRNMQDHKATPDEQRLAEALKVMVQEVGGTIEWAKDKLDSFPKAKRDLGPLLDAMGQPLTQIIGGVGLLLTGVLNLVGKLLSGLGLDGLLKGIVTATGLDKIYKGLGLGNMLKMG
ncbi:Lea domain-containing protein [Mycena venus]|uniref:Lea domain-containing protein n=1 Tax=Mycena venus TaxID=2733690 RepID=A0A8H7CF71_9AGAR|nr:Lea domain-containing protein [Mycena venus]